MSSVILKRTNQKMPLVGLGTWKIPNDVCADTVYGAIKVGYRLFDGAADYGNEKEVGEGVKRAIKDGLVKREDLFITSKLWNTNHQYDHAKAAAKYQLELWGIDYFDLFLIHFPIALKYVDPTHRFPPAWWGDDEKIHLENIPLQETWKAMEELVDEGLAKNIGLSNCQGSILLDVLRYARIEPQVLQVELHPYLTQDHLVDLAKTLGIAVNAYSSFGPQGYLELGIDKGVVGLLAHETVASIASSHKKTTAQVLLRWSTQRGIIVIPKSTTRESKYMVENLDCESFTLSDSELKALNSLNINLRLNDPIELDPRLGIFA